MTEQTIRVQSMGGIQTDRICYWKGADGRWMLYLPRIGVGDLCEHEVTEHEDGTITVSPSILVETRDAAGPVVRHGYLVRGEWRDA